MQIPDTFDNDAAELRIEIEEALSKLTNLQRKVIYELVIKDRKEKDVALEFGVTRQAVNNNKKQALKNLRKLLVHRNDYLW